MKFKVLANLGFLEIYIKMTDGVVSGVAVIISFVGFLDD
jgi:hypothetical protein